jgi:hypothetical protein
MEEDIKNAYFEVESLAYDLKYKSINQDEIKQGDNIYTLLHLINSLLKENEELKLITQNYNAFKVDSPNSTKIIIADSEYFIDGFFKEKEEYHPNVNANTYLTKQQKLQFIKDFSKIKVCNLCKDLRN